MSKSRMILSGSIDLTKIDKTKAKPHKNGSLYYPVTVFVNNEKDNYGNDCSIAQGQTKEERDAKAKTVFIGNAKVTWENKQNEATQSFAPTAEDVKQVQNATASKIDSSSLPF